MEQIEIKVYSPMRIRARIQECGKENTSREMNDGMRNRIIHGALGKSIKAALGQYNGEKYDYSKDANKKSDHVRRLVLGWLALPDEAVFEPVSSSNHDILTPKIVEGINRWIVDYSTGGYERRRAFPEELRLVIYYAQSDYKRSNGLIDRGLGFTMTDCVKYWENESAIFRNDPTPLFMYFDVMKYQRIEEISGPELLREAAKNYNAAFRDQPSNQNPPDGAVWCEWCGNVMTSPGIPCDQCKSLGADPTDHQVFDPDLESIFSGPLKQ